MADHDLLRPPPPINDHFNVPLSPLLLRPPFSHYHSSASPLPATPLTPYPPRMLPASQPSPATPTTKLTPYLTLPPRLLLIALTPALLPLLMTISHLFATRSSTAALASQLKTSVLSACSGLATGAASLQTLPRYLAMQTNDELIKATQASILGIGEGLMDVITVVEAVVNFMVDTYRSFLLCTIQLAVQGTLDVLIDAVKVISSSITSSLNAIRTNIQNDIASANGIMQAAITGINKVTGLVDVSLTVPNMTIPSLNSLENVTVPTTFENALVKLNSSLPSLSDLKTKLDAIIDTPFTLLIQQINETRLELAASFNSSILPVPALKSLAANDASSLQNQLCSGLDTSLIDDTANALHKLASVAIGLMFLILVLIWIGLCIWEWRRWKALTCVVEQVDLEMTKEANEGRVTDPWRVVGIVEHPILERYGAPVLERVAKQPRTRTNLRWYLSYLAHPTCLALLLISLLGIISLEFQLLALTSIKSHAASTANSTVTASTNSLTHTLNQAAANSSLEYAFEVNNVIASFEARLQDELFGTWLNTTAVILNQTLVEFYSEVESVLNATFGSTILYNPINTFIYCILGSKITNLEKGLTWISDNSKITLPVMRNDTLLLSNSSMNELIAPITAAAVGSSSGNDDGSGGLVGDLIQHFENALIAERNFYAIILGVWLGFALIGLIVLAWNSGGRERYYPFRGISPPGDHDTPTRSWPWTKPLPLFHEYTEKYPKPNIPTIVEPNQDSFFDYKRETHSPLRPFVPRKNTFASTLSALAAPGQAFLRATGTGSNRRDEGRGSLVTDGSSSEKYNHHRNTGTREDAETPPQLWVDRFYGVFGNVRSIWPSRGLKHGNAMATSHLQRGISQKTVNTDNSFGASRRPTATTPTPDWPRQENRYPSHLDGDGNEESEDDHDGDELIRQQQWTLVDQDSLPGQSIREGDSRYPPIHPHPHPQSQTRSQLQRVDTRTYNPSSHTVYPRPMSRAPTIYENNPHHYDHQLRAPTPPNKHDSIDYLIDEADPHSTRDPFNNPPETPGKATSEAEYPSYYGNLSHGDLEESSPRHTQPMSPASSSLSYFAADPHVESVSRVRTGTAALAAVIKNLEERRSQNVNAGHGGQDSHQTPFGDDRAERR